MREAALEEIALRLEASGHDAGHLHELQEELDSLEKPPGLFARMSTKASGVAKKQWAHVMGELQESKEAMALVHRAVTSNKKLTGCEADKVREQMLDIIRVVPASIIAAANAALPVPGTSMVTPWLLNRLGVMPSRWREAHILDELETEITRLRTEGLDEEANALDEILHDIEDEADAREQVAKEAAVLTYWDENKNGIWDDKERAAYRAAVSNIAARVRDSSHKKSWFLLHEESVIGPVRLNNFEHDEVGTELLVCWQGKSGWVILQDVLDSHASDAS
jgi:hypothetical protein